MGPSVLTISLLSTSVRVQNVPPFKTTCLWSYICTCVYILVSFVGAGKQGEETGGTLIPYWQHSSSSP